jgi:hypothetical protein
MTVERVTILLLFASLTLFFAEPSSVGQQARAPADTGDSPALTADQIVRHLEEKNRERANALRGFEGTRVYKIKYGGFFGEHDAEMTVNMSYRAPDDERFTVVSEKGSKFVIDHVLNGLLDGEREATTAKNREHTNLSAKNYNFALDGTEIAPSGVEYILIVNPKTDNKYLYRGKIWIDARDFAVTHIEAEPAKSPSFWVKKTEIHHQYVKVGDFWLPAENDTDSSIRLGGHATLSIEYKDYKITGASSLGQAQDAGARPVLQDVAPN